MGQKDLTQKNLEQYPDVFADIINALLYKGRQIILPASLQPAPTETFYPGADTDLHNQFQDVSQYVMKNGRIKIQYTLENESRTDSKMILRQAGYEGAVYRRQYENRVQEIYPVATLILHWGNHKWRSAQSLYDLFHKHGLSSIFIQCINNVRLRVYDMRFLTREIRHRFRSDMRIIVDYLAYGEQYQPTNQPIIHVEAFLRMMNALTGDYRYEWLLQNFENDSEEREGITMCGLLDKYEAKGEERVNRLISLLLKQSRWEDIEKAINNKEYQQSLFREYGL